MRVQFFGVRGSTPATGAEFVRVGGATSCVAISRGDDLPTLVLDGGTGLRRFSRWLGGRPFHGAILLGHLHWDHVQGLPFFAAADDPSSHTTVYMPAQGDPVEVMARAMSPPHFPLGPTELRGAWSFSALEPGEHTIEGYTVLALEIPHPGGRTFGYRIDDGVTAIAYLSDHNPTALGDGPDGWGEYHDNALRLAAGADLLVHDAQHLAEEFPAKAFLGHAVTEYAGGLAVAAGARRVALYHHDPDRTDDELDALGPRLAAAPVAVDIAREGLVIDLERDCR